MSAELKGSAMEFSLKLWFRSYMTSFQETAEFEKPWRDVNWSVLLSQTLNNLRTFKTSKDTKLRILLSGPIGAGKSSIINSINTAFQHRMCAGALSNSVMTKRAQGDSFTLQLKSHKIKNGKDGTHLPFVIIDTIGFEPDSARGIHPDDMCRLLQGQIKEGYTFNPLSPISEDDQNFNKDAGLNDRVHCVVWILPANNISLYDEPVFAKMKSVRQKARDLNIPQVILMTKVDKTCPLVKADLKKVYHSKKIKDKMQECSNRLGVPMNYIFPVKNYHEETDPNDDINVLILMALKHIVNFANDYVEDQSLEN